MIAAQVHLHVASTHERAGDIELTDAAYEAACKKFKQVRRRHRAARPKHTRARVPRARARICARDRRAGVVDRPPK